VEIPHGHSEILQSWTTIEEIRKFLDDPVGDTKTEQTLRIAQANIGPKKVVKGY